MQFYKRSIQVLYCFAILAVLKDVHSSSTTAAFISNNQNNRLSSSSSSSSSSSPSHNIKNNTIPTRNNKNNNHKSFSEMSSNSSNNEENDTNNNTNNNNDRKETIRIQAQAGKIEELKQKEAALSRLLAEVRIEKLKALRSKPLTIGVVGFGRFGQFIASTFAKHGTVVATSRSDYTAIAKDMGVEYVPLSDLRAFLDYGLDVIVMATSIVSFEETIDSFASHLKSYIENSGTGRGPLIVDVLSVKEFPRQIMLNLLPKECDILCTHPMFGPDSGKNGWHGLNFVYERTRIDGVILESSGSQDSNDRFGSFVEEGSGKMYSVNENSLAHVEGVDRMERFLSIWEEEGCRMVPLSCKDHDSYAANSQFITHLMGRILGAQGLKQTPIDTKGFESVMKLIDTTTADSFDLFYGLYKYNKNSMDTILKLRDSMDDVVKQLKEMEDEDQ